jgi:hypothetical protein
VVPLGSHHPAGRVRPREPACTAARRPAYLADLRHRTTGRDPHVLIRSFAARAGSHGCDLSRGRDTGRGWAHEYSTVYQCDEGNIALSVEDYPRARLACPRPATREQCEALLGKISEDTEYVHVEAASQERCPVDAGGDTIERTAEEAVPMLGAENVRSEQDGGGRGGPRWGGVADRSSSRQRRRVCDDRRRAGHRGRLWCDAAGRGPGGELPSRATPAGELSTFGWDLRDALKVRALIVDRLLFGAHPQVHCCVRHPRIDVAGGKTGALRVLP